MLKTLGLAQIIILLVVATLFIMTWDFGRRLLDNVALVQAAQAADLELERVERENELLKQLKRDVITDAWVERIARTMLHYTREWETLFIPIHRPPPPAAPAPVIVTAPPTRPFWQDFLQALFGTSP